MSAYDWKNPTRPPFAVVFCADSQGCAFHRCILPLGVAAKTGLMEGRFDNSWWSEDAFTACQPDIIVFQRQIEKHQLKMMEQTRKAVPNAWIVYEIDDLLTEVPEKNFHAGAMPPGVGEQITKAMELVDCVTVTTPLLAEWMTGLGAKDVRVIPNMMLKENLRMPKERKGKHKVRIGWGGGMSHGGDLELIKPAMAKIGDRAEWVFLGFHPEGELPCEIEFHDPVKSQDYTQALYDLDCDLFLAPLEMNRFNNAKSNLRLIESGACGGAVIAQRVDAYQDRRPPVYAYCETADDWTDKIEAFLSLSYSTQRRWGERMKDWVEKNFTYDNRLEERALAWMPKGATLFKPVVKQMKDRGVLVVHDAGLLQDACIKSRETGQHILWARPGVDVTDDLQRRLVLGLCGERVCATVPLAPDGMNSFPNRQKFHPVEQDIAVAIDRAAREMCAGLQLRIPLAFGPCVLLRGEILGILGAPDVDGYEGNVDAAIMEWTARASLRGCFCVQMADVYAGTVFAPMPATRFATLRMQARGVSQAAQLPAEPLPDDRRESVELAFFRQNWDGLRPNMSGFKDDYITHRLLARPYERTSLTLVDTEVVQYGSKPATDASWIIWVDPQTRVLPEALLRITDFLETEAAADARIVYGDHEFLSGEGVRIPFYKTDFDLEYLLQNDYITPVMAVRAGLVFASAAALLYHVFSVVQDCQRAGQSVTNVICHIPEILAEQRDDRERSVRVDDLENKLVSRCEVVESFLKDTTVKPHPQLKAMGYLQLDRRYDTRHAGKVTIIVPTKGDAWTLHPCLNSIVQHTDDVDYEILVMNTGETLVIDLGWGAERIGARQIHFPNSTQKDGVFSWSAVNNEAIKHTDAQYYLFLNDDTVPVRKDWLRNMLKHVIASDDVGVVGARLLYPHGMVQHVGITVHKGNVAFPMKGMSASNAGYHGQAALSHEVSAVTGACMLVGANLFHTLGGFNTDYVENYSDVEFCLRARDKGYRVIVATTAELHHREFATRGSPETPEAIDLILRESHKLNAFTANKPDPYWNHHFALRATGVMVAGNLFDSFAWTNRNPSPSQRRILLINDRITVSENGVFSSHGIDLQAKGNAVMMADLSGFEMVMIAPTFATPIAWDIRDDGRLSAVLRTLGVHELVLCSLSGGRSPGAGVESLKSLARLGIPVTYHGSDAESVCPRRNLLRPDGPCNNGYQGDGSRSGLEICQECIEKNGSPFGRVDVGAWWGAWLVLLKDMERADAAD